MSGTSFSPFRVVRVTGETEFAVLVRPRRRRAVAGLALPNRLLAHLIDHLSMATGVELVVESLEWPGSWALDHVLCEDLGQVVGRALRELHERRAREHGVAGRASARGCMDDADVEVVLGIEDRSDVVWVVPAAVDIDGFVDAWYDGDAWAGAATGTNLRQFVDGFARGCGATLRLEVRAAGNLHHLWEAVFRTLGDAVARAVGVERERLLPGDTSGLAGPPRWEVRAAGASSDE